MINLAARVSIILICISSNLSAAHMEYSPKKSFAQTTRARIAGDRKHKVKTACMRAKSRNHTNQQILGALLLVSISGAYAEQASQQIGSQHPTQRQASKMIEKEARRAQVSPSTTNETNLLVCKSFIRNGWDVCHEKGPGLMQCCKFPDHSNLQLECCRFDLGNNKEACEKTDITLPEFEEFILEDWQNIKGAQSFRHELKNALKEGELDYYHDREDKKLAEDLSL